MNHVKRYIWVYLAVLIIPESKLETTNDWENASSIYDFTVKDIQGNEVDLHRYKGHVCIIVNVASNCGYTKGHYDSLNILYEKYHKTQGLEILGFPCNQFGFQEPGTNSDICSFVESKNVKFDMFSKINVNGNDAHPLFKFLKLKQGGTLGDFIKWNFTKFVIDKNGKPVQRSGPNVDPLELEEILLKLFDQSINPENNGKIGSDEL